MPGWFAPIRPPTKKSKERMKECLTHTMKAALEIVQRFAARHLATHTYCSAQRIAVGLR
eukprot:COSAG01_NODE_221_length_21422_cov_48.284294_17_plen_59_part_00